MNGSRIMPRGAIAFITMTAIATVLVIATEHITRVRAAQTQDSAAIAEIADLLPVTDDAQWRVDRVLWPADPELGTTTAQAIYRARRQGQPAGVVLPVIAREGYNGPIELRVGLDSDGRILGVRLIAHRETPRLGGQIEPQRSDWLARLQGRSLSDPPLERWAVRRDGGDFDQLAGATQTPRVIIAAVRRALVWYQARRDAVFAARSAS
jgi:electron transport complex protein RnfG